MTSGSALYKILNRAIERKNYKSKEDMKEKLSILYANSQLTTDEYNYLMKLLEIYKEEVKED
ncbi:Uncharacterised protein [[Clostridium] sordellii]|uniref:hypothetical protein n=1 Tax=Paraclostridium sordellii TaxID=1505 RepID=UPI0005E0132D|nr:hypothetical protein [Paeniclostridium sordellii]CEQ26493.1 Uncharacterised protein [[Clostridium] sordellii] [Paeniclostridium sordellii]